MVTNSLTSESKMRFSLIIRTRFNKAGTNIRVPTKIKPSSFNTKTIKKTLKHFFKDDHGDDQSMTVLEELEKIDDDCDRHGIQFVKIDDKKAAKAFGLDEVSTIINQ